MNDDQRAREWLLSRYEGRHQFADESSLAELLGDVRAHERELMMKTRSRRQLGACWCDGDEMLQAAVKRLPVPVVATVNAVANAFLGSTVHLHHPDGRHVVVSLDSVCAEHASNHASESSSHDGPRSSDARPRTCENPSTCREGTVFRLVGDGIEARFCVTCDLRYETRAVEGPRTNEAQARVDEILAANAPKATTKRRLEPRTDNPEARRTDARRGRRLPHEGSDE